VSVNLTLISVRKYRLRPKPEHVSSRTWLLSWNRSRYLTIVDLLRARRDAIDTSSNITRNTQLKTTRHLWPIVIIIARTHVVATKRYGMRDAADVRGCKAANAEAAMTLTDKLTSIRRPPAPTPWSMGARTPHFYKWLGTRALWLEGIESISRCNNMSRMNLSEYVGHVTIFSWVFTIACCLVVGLGLGLDLIWSVSCNALVFVRL